jgi:6-phosphogluconolactonase
VLDERERWVVADRVDATPSARVTLTVPVLNAAALAMFLVAGADKAPMLHRVLEGPHDPATLPAQLVAPRDGRVRWIVDATAAANLRRR